MPNNYDLPEKEYYPTPQDSIKGLFEIIDFKNLVEEGFTFAEPCKGEASAIYQHFPKGSEYCEIQEGKDYLESSWDKNPDIIITNPPFSLAVPFLIKSMKESDVQIYLLKLAFLESKGRHEFNKENPPDHLIIMSKRPSFVGGGTDKAPYGWFIYDRKGILGLQKPFYFIL